MASFVTATPLKDGTIFNGAKESHVELIELSPNTPNRRNLMSEEFVQKYVENDFNDILTPKPNLNAKPNAESLKLFYSLRQGKYDGSVLPIPISADLFKRITPYARICKPYIESILYRASFHVQAYPQIPMSSHLEKLEPQERVHLLDDEYLSFVVQPIPAQNNVCLGGSFTYHFPTHTMFSFMHGQPGRHGYDFPVWLERGDCRETYFLIPSLMLNSNLEGRLEGLNKWHDQIYQLEVSLGIRHDVNVPHDPTKVDYIGLSKSVNAVTTDLAFFAWQCKTNIRLLKFMDEIASKYRQLAIKNKYDEDEAARVERVLLETHEHLRCWNASLADRVEYLSKRGQALVQIVYSGIAQRDSANSLSLATTSTRLAETSQEVAIATSRDSAVMRIIAAITIFFLPATFTATFFSTSFFNFDVGRNEQVYSWWLWLYFLVTVVLTAAVMVGTWILWKGKENEIASRFVKPKEG